MILKRNQSLHMYMVMLKLRNTNISRRWIKATSSKIAKDKAKSIFKRKLSKPGYKIVVNKLS